MKHYMTTLYYTPDGHFTGPIMIIGALVRLQYA